MLPLPRFFQEMLLQFNQFQQSILRIMVLRECRHLSLQSLVNNSFFIADHGHGKMNKYVNMDSNYDLHGKESLCAHLTSHPLGLVHILRYLELGNKFHSRELQAFVQVMGIRRLSGIQMFHTTPMMHGTKYLDQAILDILIDNRFIWIRDQHLDINKLRMVAIIPDSSASLRIIIPVHILRPARNSKGRLFIRHSAPLVHRRHLFMAVTLRLVRILQGRLRRFSKLFSGRRRVCMSLIPLEPLHL
mmetsp:Transcript_30807/g.55831  ORF Transcript_30807/g.55831 Transcript_30807/m.55831 type:complete len:245 (+) Transcript_30807:1441-2175(+)